MDESFTVHEAPLKLINVPKTDSKTLGSVVRLFAPILPANKSMQRSTLDGASNMSGHIRGVAAQIQREEPSALYALFSALHKPLFANCWHVYSSG